MGYHKRKITKGTLGEFSKIKEEFEELEDAYEQKDKILQLCELSDLLGAIDFYVDNQFNMRLIDLISFSKKTQEAFKNGER